MSKMTPEERRAYLNGSAEPRIDPLNYRVSMLKAMNWYGIEKERKVRIGYTQTWAKKVNFDLSGVTDSAMAMCGSVCRMISRGEPIDDSDVAKIQQILEGARKPVTSEDNIKPKVSGLQSKPDPLEELTNDLIETFEQAIDSNLNKPGAFQFNYDFCKGQNPKVIKVVLDHVKSRFKEILEAYNGTDSQLKEGYSHISRRGFNHFIKFYETVIDTLSKQSAVAKVQRKVKPRKEKSPAIVVKNLKYLKEFPEYNLQSVQPESIVGAKQVTLFNTKYRKLILINCLEGETLTVKGTSILNFDPSKSLMKTLRKPEEILSKFIKCSIRNSNSEFKSIKSTEKEFPGRVNSEMIILNVNR